MGGFGGGFGQPAEWNMIFDSSACCGLSPSTSGWPQSMTYTAGTQLKLGRCHMSDATNNEIQVTVSDATGGIIAIPSNTTITVLLEYS